MVSSSAAPLLSMRSTASAIGISTPWRRASAATPSPERDSERHVTRIGAVAAQVDVANPREAEEGLEPRAHGDAQARRLGQAASDQHGARVRAELHAGRDAAGDG